MIQDLCAFLSHHERVPVGVLCRPDRVRGNEATCDAIVQRGSIQVAVEHTRVYSAPQKPGQIKRLETVRGTIQERVVRAFPRSIVRIAIPVEDLVPGTDWTALASRLADGCIELLGRAITHQRVVLEVDGLRSKVFAERLLDDVSNAHCVVSPVIWGRDPEELTIDDICRALMDKSNLMQGYRRAGVPTLLLLDVEEPLWPNAFIDLFERALERQSARAFDEVFLILSGFPSSIIEPLRSVSFTADKQSER